MWALRNGKRQHRVDREEGSMRIARTTTNYDELVQSDRVQKVLLINNDKVINNLTFLI